ncbi:hypothetical protein L4D06_25030 [Enterovibrio makurazakiensis]|uniref:DUF3800 domain-containing protein n=1 Tax=Enterovibrio makurazakiensis TaxID=2910232 RepID=UPI003D1AE379
MDPLSITFDSEENNYTFYYDESNNVRTLSLETDKYNVDNDDNQKASMNFILAGIAHKSDVNDINVSTLIEKLALQDNVKEIKFKHIAKGNFEQVLKSQKLTVFLEWLLESSCYVHYFNLNMEYWSFIDLIDDVFFYAVNKKPNSFNHTIDARHYLDYYKDALYRLVRLDKATFISLVKKYNYPKIRKGFESKLIREINKIIKENIRYNNILKTGIDEQTQREFRDLSGLLSICSDIDKLETTYDLDEDLLLSGFHSFYHNRGVSFKYSSHKFDMESIIEEKFEILKKAGDHNLINLNYSFVNSEESRLIQISDVVSGLFNKYFTYVNFELLENIKDKRKQLNDRQLLNLNLLREIVDKSDLECSQFLFYVMSLSESEKHNILLFEKEKI